MLQLLDLCVLDLVISVSLTSCSVAVAGPVCPWPGCISVLDLLFCCSCWTCVSLTWLYQCPWPPVLLQLLDLCVLDTDYLQFPYSIVAAAAFYHMSSKEHALATLGTYMQCFQDPITVCAFQNCNLPMHSLLVTKIKNNFPCCLANNIQFSNLLSTNRFCVKT